MTGYPWSAGETLTAADLNAAIGAVSWHAGLVTALGSNLTLSGGGTLAATVPVTSVAARIGAVVLTHSDVTDWSTAVPASTVISTGSTTARSLADRFADVANALDFGADATGAADSAAAITAALATGKNVWLPKGTYHVRSQLTVTGGQVLYGDGRGLTTITVSDDFSTTNTGVISLTGREQSAPEVRDLDMAFTQPASPVSRASFATLAGGGTNSTGVKYPPAIIITSANRFKLSNLRVSTAWDGIINASTNTIGGFFIRDIEMCAFNCGLSLDRCFDFGHVSGYHFWDFGCTNAQFTNVYADGNTYAARFGDNGEVDGINVVDFDSFRGRVSITSANSWMNFANLQMDGHGATLEVSNGQWIQISNPYFTGNATGANTNSQVTVTGGSVFITNIHSSNASLPAVTITGGRLQIVGGYLSPQSTTGICVAQSGGDLKIAGVTFSANTGAGAWTVPVVNVTSGNTVFSNNNFAVSAGDVGGLVLASDSVSHAVSGNDWNGWSFTVPGNLGWYGGNSDGLLYATGAGYSTRAAVFIQPAATVPATRGMVDISPPSGTANSLESKLRFWSTFATTTDYGARFTSTLRSGMTAAWGTGYLDIYLSNTTNDVADDANTTRAARFTTTGLNNCTIGATTAAGATLSALSVTGSPTVTFGGNTSTGNGLVLNAAAASARVIRWQTAGNSRWLFGGSTDAEGGANAGCNLQITRYNDAGSSVDIPFSINRATGLVTMSDGAAITGGTINNATIGATTTSTGAFTTLSASSTVSGTGFSTYLASPPAIGGSAAAAGSFTTLSASSTVSGTGFSTYLASPPAIGGTASAAGSFTTLAATTSLTIGLAAGGANLINTYAAAGNNRLMQYFSGANLRWAHGANNTAETGSNAGSNWEIYAYSDASGFLSTPISITRSTGVVTMSSGAAITGGSLNNAPVGGTTASTGAFTTLSASSTVAGTGFSTYLASPPAIGGTVAAAGSFTTLSASSTVSGAGFSTYLASPPAIGGSAAAAGSFTTLSASSTVSGTGFSTYLASPPAIGGTAAAAGKFTTLQATGLITPAATIGIVGTTTNDNAQAGSIGEYVSSTVLVGSAVSLTTATSANITSISLTAGDWDVSGSVIFVPAATTTVTALNGGIGTTTATLPTVPPLARFAEIWTSYTPNSTLYRGVATIRQSLSGTTTVYLVTQSSFGTSTMTAYGHIAARRVR
jgi:Pectate lyase superfamily protein